MARTPFQPPAARWLEEWADIHYHHLPVKRFGLRGASLLCDLLSALQRRTLVLPGFICTDLPAMARHLGLRILHIDVDRQTAQMRPELVRRCLDGLDIADTILLVDHVFGYPSAAIAEWARDFPGLFVVEDCVRALGAEVGGAQIGHLGHAVLFSLYKTTIGNDDGALLLSSIAHGDKGPGKPGAATIRQWAAGVRPVRKAHSWFKRLAPPLTAVSRALDAPHWAPTPGMPNELCCRRFKTQLQNLSADQAARHQAWDDLYAALSDIDDVQLISPPANARTSAFFLSFSLARPGQRDAVVNALQRRGLFLAWAWNVVPSFYRCFSTTFPYGAADSEFLAGHICHVPLDLYRSRRERRRLVDNLRAAVRSFR
jgi:dTDP-4-amino-4,6-dideoxygalactose transaminase